MALMKIRVTPNKLGLQKLVVFLQVLFKHHYGIY